MHLIAALPTSILALDGERGTTAPVRGADDRPTCAAADARQAWCGTRQSGVYRSDDGGAAWTFAGLRDLHVTAVAVGPRGVVWAGTERSQLWRSDDGVGTWQRMEAMEALPSSWGQRT
jgi:photosystem II stability/assembly factor-like uncharacterized protein